MGRAVVVVLLAVLLVDIGGEGVVVVWTGGFIRTSVVVTVVVVVDGDVCAEGKAVVLSSGSCLSLSVPTPVIAAEVDRDEPPRKEESCRINGEFVGDSLVPPF